MSRVRRRGLLLLLGAGAPLLGLVLIEGLLSLTGGLDEPVLERVDPGGGLVLRRMAPPAPRGTMTADRLEARIPKPTGTYRIVVVGESTAAGFPWYPWFSFGRILEQRLRGCEPARPVEVVNLALAADSSDRVREVALAALEAEPDLLLVCTGHNDHQVPYDQRMRSGGEPAWKTLVRRSRLRRLLLGSVAPSLSRAPRLPEGRLVADEPFLDAEERARGVVLFQRNLEAILDACERSQVPCLLLTQAANLRDFPPSCSSFSPATDGAARPGFEADLARLQAEVARGATDAATRAGLERLRDQDPQVALVHYLLGQVAYQEGAREEAAVEFDRALALDTYPNRAPPAFNEAIRAQDGRAGVEVLDVAHAFAGWSGGARPGRDLFLDHCHPSLAVTFRLAEYVFQDLVPRLRQAGVLTAGPIPAWDPLQEEQRETMLRAMGVQRSVLAAMTLGAGRLNLLAWLEAPASREPLALAEHAFRITLSVEPRNTEALSGLVALALIREERDRAVELAAEATAVDPAALAGLESLCSANTVLQGLLDRNRLQFLGGQLVDKP